MTSHKKKLPGTVEPSNENKIRFPFTPFFQTCIISYLNSGPLPLDSNHFSFSLEGWDGGVSHYYGT